MGCVCELGQCCPLTGAGVEGWGEVMWPRLTRNQVTGDRTTRTASYLAAARVQPHAHAILAVGNDTIVLTFVLAGLCFT